MSAPATNLKVVAAGSAGVDELKQYVDDSTVSFAVVKFEFGSGSFKRNKFLFLHVNGENCSAVKVLTCPACGNVLLTSAHSGDDTTLKKARLKLPSVRHMQN